MVISSWIAGHAPSPVGCRPDAAQCTRSLKRRLHHVNLPVMSTYKALFEKGSCCMPTAGDLRSASACARGFTTDLSAFESVSHPSALKRLRVCQGVATVPDGRTSLRLAPQACAFAALRGAGGARPAWRSTELASRWRAGAAGEISQWGHGRGAGRRRWVGSREKWLYFSYTPTRTRTKPISPTGTAQRATTPATNAVPAGSVAHKANAAGS
jgi:hypothetical protein